ncbi:MAG: ArsC/Spx/MgsR family protein [Pseudomonadota bacterium]
MRVWGLKNCDTCRKAVQTLSKAGFDPVFIDVRVDGLADADLDQFLDQFSDTLLNRRSTTWRGLSASDQVGDPKDLVKRFPAVMKRPVIEDDNGSLHLGWSSVTQSALGI